jgi:hypothetical protein
MNEQARFLVEDDLIRAGEPLDGELGSLAARLAVDGAAGDDGVAARGPLVRVACVPPTTGIRPFS